jgi:hypothetical protein
LTAGNSTRWQQSDTKIAGLTEQVVRHELTKDVEVGGGVRIWLNGSISCKLIIARCEAKRWDLQHSRTMMMMVCLFCVERQIDS